MVTIRLPSANPFSMLAFSSEDFWKEEEDIKDSISARHQPDFQREQSSEPYISTYVRVFEGERAPSCRSRILIIALLEMLKTILQNESHLFNDEEIEYFDRYANLSCKVQPRDSVVMFLTDHRQCTISAREASSSKARRLAPFR